jgi:hypothetical protein
MRASERAGAHLLVQLLADARGNDGELAHLRTACHVSQP